MKIEAYYFVFVTFVSGFLLVTLLRNNQNSDLNIFAPE